MKNVSIITIGTFLIIGTLISCLSNKSEVITNITKPTVFRSVDVTRPDAKTYSVDNLTVDSSQIIFFNVPVTEKSVEITIGRIRELESKKKSIYIVLASPGGSVFDGGRLIDYMDASKVKINTLNYSMCASMCAHIFEHGATRYALAHSTLMFHQAAGEVYGQMKNMNSQLAYATLEVMKLDAYDADRSDMSPNVFDALQEHEAWIAGDTAVDMHLADKLAIINISDVGGDIFFVENKNTRGLNLANELAKQGFKTESKIKLDNPLQNMQ